jgi:NTE family protein
MAKQLAFVLGGGGGRGALQAGALRALLESGYKPALLVGTSAGAINAAYLALKGVDLNGVAALELAWQEAAKLNLYPSNYLWLSVRAVFNRPTPIVYQRVTDFFIAHGVTPELRFKDICDVRLFLVAADLNNGRPKLFGQNPEDSVLEGLLASTALPPWVTPIQRPGQILVDGGVISNLPVEPALSQGATEIIALDIRDFRDVPAEMQGFGSFLSRLIGTVENRQVEMELALAAARRVQVRHIHLIWKDPVPVWDFSRTDKLIQHGYEAMRAEIDNWQPEKRPWWAKWMSRDE